MLLFVFNRSNPSDWVNYERTLASSVKRFVFLIFLRTANDEEEGSKTL
jgi:hypothetical protein